MNRTKLCRQALLAVAALFALGSTAHAGQLQLPAELPAFGPAKPIPIPKIAKKTLPNGLEVWVVPRHGLPRVDYVMAVRGAGFGADTSAQSGLAAMLANVLADGTAKRDSRAVAEATQGMGGKIRASASNDGITVSANALSSSAPAMLQLLAEVVRTPAYPDGEVQLAKANTLHGLRASEANPGYRAERAIGFAVYGDHAYARSRFTVESVSAVTAELLRAEHARRFRPERSLLVVAGRVNAEQLFKQVQAAFGEWKASNEAPAALQPPSSSAAPQRLLLERPGSVQSTLRLGSLGTHAAANDQVPLRLASTVIGSGFNSRVNLNLREEKGYTYGASAGARSFRDGGAIIGAADVRNEVTAASLREFFAEYKRLGSDLVGEDELAMNKRYVAGGYLISTQLLSAMAGTLANNWLIGLPAEFLGNYVPMIQKVTAEQLREIGKKYFDPATQSIVVVGDKAAVGEQLKEFGEFTLLAN